MEPEGLFANRYRIRRLIGRGGTAAVYEAIDETTGRSVALKRLHAEQAKRRATVLLFQREYHTLAELTHPLIIRAFDYGVEGETPYYTMEALSGENLRNLAPLPWREAASVVRDVASALALVHSRRLIHRDVSPRNVCRTADGRAKLIDFGTLSPMGAAREIMGTPPFLSPESLEERPLDARSDLFSLGAVAYHLLTGEHAYPARRIVELGHVWLRPVPPPSSRAPDVPESLDALILSLINLNPLARPGSAAEVFDRLTAIADLPKAEAPETARAYFLTPTLVARDDAVQRFRRRLLRAERGRGGALLVEAPRGYGRSRLLRSLLLEAKLRGMVALRAGGDDGRMGPFGVVRALVRGLEPTEPGLCHETLGGSLAKALGLGDAASGGAPIDPAEWVSVSRQAAEWFVALSRRRSLVVGVDDFDDCDGPSAAVIAILAESAGSEPILVVATSPSESRTAHVERMRQASGRLVLAPFQAADTRRLLSSVFGDTPHVEEVADWVHRLSEGVPRTALELAQHLVNQGHAYYRDGGWILPPTIEGLDLPKNVDQALDERVAVLPPRARALAEALAVASDDDPPLLSEFPALMTDRDLGAIFGALNDLVSASVLVPSESTYRFAHANVKEAVRRAIFAERLPEIHRRLARAYESGPDRVTTLAAYHVLRAGDAADAFRLAAASVERADDYFARGNSFIRTPAGAEMIESVFEWGRAHAAPARDMSLVARGVLQLASVGDARLARHAPVILEELKRDSGLVFWNELAAHADPVERIRACIGKAYAEYEAAPDKERRLDPGTAVEEVASAAATLAGVYARNADVVSMAALDELVAPLRPLSPALDVVGGVVNYAVGALRGHPTREKRLRVVEQTRRPVAGIDELSRLGLHLLGLYYMALEDALHGYSTADELLAPLDGHAAFAPLAWQARMLSHYYRGNEKEAAACRRRRDLAMTGRLDIDGHLETSVLYESSVYATLGDLMALKSLLPALEERSLARPGWRPYFHLASGNCHFLRGEHERALEEYERARTVEGIPERHTGVVLSSIRAVRSLVALGRGEEARNVVDATLAIYRDEPLMPLYVDQLELGLAGAELTLGRASEALARAGRVVARAKRRGLSGVLLVDFLAENADIARAAGDHDVFDALTKRIGELAAKGDSAAVAWRHSRLVRLGRSSNSGRPARLSESPGESVCTTLGADVRTKLELCRGSSERAARALRLLIDYSGSVQGFLYLNREGALVQTAAIPRAAATDALDEAVRDWARLALDTEAPTQTASRSQPPSRASSPFEIVGILASMNGASALAGVALLRADHGRPRPIPSAVLIAIGEGLLHAGDATAMTRFGNASS